MEIPLVTGGYCEGRSNEYDSQKSSHRIADEWNLGKEEDQTMTQPFGNFHAIPLNLGKTKELCSDTGQQTSLPIASMQQNPEQLGRYRTRTDRKRVVQGKRVQVRVHLGGRRTNTKQKKTKQKQTK